VYIPVKEFPEINFFGLLVGPRGNSLKKMERDSGAKISIRGKGSVKEGKARPDQYADDAEEDLHCLVLADTDEKVAACVKMINRVIETVSIITSFKRYTDLCSRPPPHLKAKMTTNEISFANLPHSTGLFVTMKIKFVKIAAVSVTANTTAQNKEISLPTSSVVFVVALATWLVTVPSTRIRMPRLLAVLRLR
jgi:KH domain